jgi:hypothetical protein
MLVTTAPLTDKAIIAAVEEPATEPCEKFNSKFFSQMTAYLESQRDKNK